MLKVTSWNLDSLDLLRGNWTKEHATTQTDIKRVSIVVVVVIIDLILDSCCILIEVNYFISIGIKNKALVPRPCRSDTLVLGLDFFYQIISIYVELFNHFL